MGPRQDSDVTRGTRGSTDDRGPVWNTGSLLTPGLLTHIFGDPGGPVRGGRNPEGGHTTLGKWEGGRRNRQGWSP